VNQFANSHNANSQSIYIINLPNSQSVYRIGLHCQFYFQLGVLLPSSRVGLPALLRRCPAAAGRPPAASSPLLAVARPPRQPPRAQRRPRGGFQRRWPGGLHWRRPPARRRRPWLTRRPARVPSPPRRGERLPSNPVPVAAEQRYVAPCRLLRRRPLQPPMAAPAAALPSRAGTAGSSAGGGRAGVRRPPARPALARRPAVPSLRRAAR
jgi:hypothetical protein